MPTSTTSPRTPTSSSIENKLTYPIVRYSSADATKDFGTKRMPESFVIDRDGNVVALQRYQVDDEWLNTVLPPVLAEKPTEQRR